MPKLRKFGTGQKDHLVDTPAARTMAASSTGTILTETVRHLAGRKLTGTPQGGEAATGPKRLKLSLSQIGIPERKTHQTPCKIQRPPWEANRCPITPRFSLEFLALEEGPEETPSMTIC